MDFDEKKFATALAERDKAVLDRLEAFDKKTGERFEALQDRVEEIESKRGTPGRVGNSDPESREHKKLFFDWLRKPGDTGRKNKLAEFEMHAKSVNLGSSADGAFAVPEEIGRDIEKLEIKLSPVRNLVKVVRVGSGDYKDLVNIGGAGSGWVGETTSRTETNTPQLRERAPTFGEIYAYPQVTEWAMDDIFFNVQDWLTEEVAEQFAYQEGVAVLTGNGSNKPTGMFNTAPVTTADDASPKRDAAAYQYLLSGDNSPAGLDGDALIDLVYAVNAKYRAGASWVMNSSTAGAVRKLKDPSTGLYLWQPALAAGQPDALLGYPVSIWEQMPDIGGGNLPIGFGNFRRGYLLCDRTEVRITVDNNITTPGKIKFFVRRREGGCVLNNDAVKFLKLL